MPKLEKLPKPVSKKSSKKVLMEEIDALRSEVQALQELVNHHRDEKQKLTSHLDFYTHQVETVKKVLSLEIS